MTIVDSKIFEFSLPLKQSIKIKNIEFRQRRGFILLLRDHLGYTGYGEGSPLKGISIETTDQAGRQLKNFSKKLINCFVSEDAQRLDGYFERWLEPEHLFPSVRCGVETAVFNLFASQKGKSVSALLSRSRVQKLYVNALLTGEKKDVVREAKNALQKGFRSLKLKVGQEPLALEIEKVQALRKLLKKNVLIRLDANRRWHFDEAVTFGKSIGPENIEYIEEPFADFSKVSDFYRVTGIPVAFDETLRDLTEIKKTPGLKALILKPMLLGGLEKTLGYIRRSKAVGLMPIISSTFESGAGLNMLIHLAAASHESFAAGLDTQKYFQKDILKTRLVPHKGFFDIRKLQKQPHINFSLLKEIKNG